MSKKAVIIGCGNIGSTIAYTLALKNTVDEIYLIDRNTDKTEGHVQDINHGQAVNNTSIAYLGTYADSKNADIIILTVSVNQVGITERTQLLDGNLNLFKEILNNIKPFLTGSEKFLIISNPCDILAYFTMKYLNLTSEQVFSSGTLLDSSRYHYFIKQILENNNIKVDAMILGEHGDTSVPIYSLTKVDNNNLEDVLKDKNITLNKEKLQVEMNQSGFDIVTKKGCTNFATAMSVEKLISCILNKTKQEFIISTHMKNAPYFEGDYFMSFIVKFKNSNLVFKENLNLSEKETSLLNKSKEKLIALCNYANKYLN